MRKAYVGGGHIWTRMGIKVYNYDLQSLLKPFIPVPGKVDNAGTRLSTFGMVCLFSGPVPEM